MANPRSFSFFAAPLFALGPKCDTLGFMLDFIVSLDHQIFLLINTSWTSAWGNLFFPFVTDLHKTLFFKVVMIPVIFWIFCFRRGLKKGAVVFLFCLMSILISDGVGNIIKKSVERPRPGDTVGLGAEVRSSYGGYSFVSNHAVNMFNFCSFTGSIYPPAAPVLYGIATLIGYSRIYNGVHFPLDVIGGGLLGILFGLSFAYACKKILLKMDRNKKVTP